MANFKSQFEEKTTKDDVDTLEAEIRETLGTVWTEVGEALSLIVEQNNFEGLKRIETMRQSYEKDYDKVLARLEQSADARKAELDQEAANQARGILDAAKLRYTNAGKEESKLTNLRQIAIDDLQSTTD